MTFPNEDNYKWKWRKWFQSHSPIHDEIDEKGEGPRIFEADLSFICYITDEGAQNCSQFNQFYDKVSHFYIFLSVLIIRHCESDKQCCYLSSDDQSYESTTTASYSE